MLIERLQDAFSRRDAGAVAALVAPDYRSEQPAHPGRRFVGAEQAHKNWSAAFESIPDFRSQLVRGCADGDVEWAEWDWSGTHRDGTPYRQRGVTIFGVRDGVAAWGRLYVELVEDDSDIEANIDAMTHRRQEG